MAVALHDPPARMLRLALTLPDDGSGPESLILDARQAGTQKYGWIARSGGGKSYGAGKLAELLFSAGIPLIVLDPVGNWYGLRLAADGLSPGLGIPVIGGPRGDLPLDLERAPALAQWLVEHDGSAVIDLSELRKNERKRFVAAFAEALFHAAKSNRRPRMVIIEEAQVFAPQMSKGSEQMLGAIEDLVRLGRNYGIGSMLISQRPQSVNKEVLNQVECLFVGQLQGSHERKAIGAWCAGKQQEMPAAELASLQPGTFFCWSPQWLRWFGRVEILRKETFDASATPDLDAGPLVQAPLRKMDLESLREALVPPPQPRGKKTTRPEPAPVSAEVAEQIGAESVRAELAAAADELVRVAAQRDGLEQLIETLARRLDGALGTLRAVLNDARGLEQQLIIARGEATVSRETRASLPSPSDTPRRRAEPARKAVAEGRVRTVVSVDGDLASMMLAAMGSAGRLLSRVELAIRVGVMHSGGYYRGQLRGLVEAGLITSSDAGNLMLTERGKARAQASIVTPPRGKALVATWIQRLKGAAPGILQALIDHRAGLDSAALAEAIGGKAASGGYFRKGLRQVRNAGLVVGDAGRWQLSDEAKHLGR